MVAKQRRSDTIRNQRKLLEAVSELVREAPESVTMQAIAARAEIAPATAYRYFSSIDELLTAYLLQTVIELRDYSTASNATGRALFEDVLGEWIRLIGVHGPVIVQLRSRRGFLERLHAEEPVISTVYAAWEQPLRHLLRELELPTSLLAEARFLCNILFDPREVLDLTEESGKSAATVRKRLTGAYIGALRGWHRPE